MLRQRREFCGFGGLGQDEIRDRKHGDCRQIPNSQPWRANNRRYRQPFR